MADITTPNPASSVFPAKLIYQPVAGFVEQIAAKSAAPGGGSAAALAGAIGSGLLTMVINFTVDKKDYAAVAPHLSQLKQVTEEARAALVKLVDEDTDAFNRFRVANKLPERDDPERAVKAAELAAAAMGTLQVPRRTMQTCLRALECALDIARTGNVNTVSDAATGAELLSAGLEGAAANVLINLPGIPETERPALLAEVAVARGRSRGIVSDVRHAVAEKLGG
ncbi:cyclodeaminase/cyclohydrolase family protein [candidate division KSB1 bacterium]|nr:cyclodeaminase/cyclohydrolase family protein [candidate division KSB1 bacterium]